MELTSRIKTKIATDIPKRRKNPICSGYTYSYRVLWTQIQVKHDSYTEYCSIPQNPFLFPRGLSGLWSLYKVQKQSPKYSYKIYIVFIYMHMTRCKYKKKSNWPELLVLKS